MKNQADLGGATVNPTGTVWMCFACLARKSKARMDEELRPEKPDRESRTKQRKYRPSLVPHQFVRTT